jgi:hypothetical protein
MTKKEKYWTETYHSWAEYEQKHPDWDKCSSTRIAAGFARMQLKEKGVYIAECFSIPLNTQVHRDVTKFLKELDKAEKVARDHPSNVVYGTGLEAVAV